MGRPDVDIEPPRLVATVLGAAQYAIGWGQDPGTGDGWHSATDRDVPGERMSSAQWWAITGAATQSEAALAAVLAAGPTARAWSKAAARAEAAAQGGAAALLAACRDRYAAWHGAPLTSPWVTA